MKLSHIFKVILLLLLPFFVLAQYPNNPIKSRLGWQTTGDGLVYRGAGAPAYSPGTLFNAWMYLDTTNYTLYMYRNFQWTKLPLVNNGLTLDGSYVQLGGTLVENTTVERSTYTLDFGKKSGANNGWMSFYGTDPHYVGILTTKDGTESGLTIGNKLWGFEVDDSDHVSSFTGSRFGFDATYLGTLGVSQFKMDSTRFYIRGLPTYATHAAADADIDSYGMYQITDGRAIYARTGTADKVSPNIQDNGTAVSILNSKPFQLGQWTTAGRPSPINGYIGRNTDRNRWEGYNVNRWESFVTSADSAYTVGDIYNVSSWADTVGWTRTNSTVSLGSSKLSFSAGANDYMQRFKFDQPHIFEKWQWDVKTIATQKDATSYGYAFGVESSNTSNSFKFGLAVRFIGQTGSDQGKIQLVSITGASNTATILTTSTSALTYSANDTIVISIRREQGQLTADAWNATTNSGRVSLEYNYTFTTSSTVPSSTGNFTIFSIGGTFQVLDTKLTSREMSKPAIITLGDSKFAGYGANEIPFRASELIKPTLGSVVVWSGGGDKTAELLSTIGYAARRIQPKAAIISIGSNDVRLSVPSATYLSNYDKIVDTLEAAGVVVYHAPFYESAFPITTLYNHIVATYPAARIIPTYEITSSFLSVDNVHPNEAGNQRIANIINAKDSLPVGSNNGVEKPIAGSIASGGLVAYSSSGNRLKGQGANGLIFDETNVRLSIGGAGSVGTLHGPLTNSSANFDFFTLDGPTVPYFVSFGSHGSLWNNGVTAQTLHGLNFGANFVFGVGTANSTDLQLRAVSTGNNVTFQDRGAKRIFYWKSNGVFSEADMVAGNAYAGGSNIAGATFRMCAGLGSGTGTAADLIFQTGTTAASGTTDHARTDRWWIKGGTGRLGNTSSPSEDLHVVGDGYFADSLRVGTLPNQTSATKILSADASGWVGYRSFSDFATSNIYTADGTFGTGRVGTLTDSLRFRFGSNDLFRLKSNGVAHFTMPTESNSFVLTSTPSENYNNYRGNVFMVGTTSNGDTTTGTRRNNHDASYFSGTNLVEGGNNVYYNAVSGYGNSVRADEPKNIVYGVFNTITGVADVGVYGYGNTISGRNTTVFGRDNNVSAIDAFVIGRGNTVTQNNSYVYGSLIGSTNASLHGFGTLAPRKRIDVNGDAIVGDTIYNTSPATHSTNDGLAVWKSTALGYALGKVEMKRDTTIYVSDADYNFAAAITSANILARYNRVIIYSKLSSGATSDNQIFLHTASSDFLQCTIEIYSEDASADADETSADFTTNGAVNGTGGTVSAQSITPGQTMYIRAINDGGYKWKFSKSL